MNPKILFVDDEASILAAIKRLLHKHPFTLLTASSGEEAIDIMKENTDITVVVSDMKMPGMNGAQVLANVKDILPMAERVALTGQADLSMILDSINSGGVQRFLTKPWDEKILIGTVEEGSNTCIAKREKAERDAKMEETQGKLVKAASVLSSRSKQQADQLDKAQSLLKATFRGFQYTLLDMLDMHESGLKGHGRRVAVLSRMLAEKLGLAHEEQEAVESAGLLHDIGKMAVTSGKIQGNAKTRSEQDKIALKSHSALGHDILIGIDGFEKVATIVKYHHDQFKKTDEPGKLSGKDIPMGSRIVAVANAYENLRYAPGTGAISVGGSKAEEYLKVAAGTSLDPDLVEAFVSMDLPDLTALGEEEIKVGIEELAPGMVLTRPIMTDDNRILVPSGKNISQLIIDELKVSKHFDPVASTIWVNSNFSSKEEIEAGDTVIIPAQQVVESAKKEEKEKDKLTRELIVVVDDDPHICRALKRELSRAGYDVESFTDAMNGLRQIQMEPNLLALITDFNMPGVRGDKFLKRVQEEMPDLPCIVLTGHARTENIMLLAKAAKIRKIFTKPWDREQLLETLEEIKQERSAPTDADEGEQAPAKTEEEKA